MFYHIFKNTIILAILIAISVLSTSQSFAFESGKLGVHILNLDEALQAKQVVKLENDQDTWNYLTIPLTLKDLSRKEDWQQFFDVSREQKLIPLVRLTTEYNAENDAWEIPTKKNIYDQIEFLSSLDWPTDKKHIIIFNEVNHAKEWGGSINPEEYSEVLRFAADWAHTENNGFVVLPAGLDLAAPNGYKTKEAFTYLNQMLQADPDIFEVVDVWNSHSYPNPGFSSSPTRYAQNSLRGYQYELNYLKQKTAKDFNVMITETGWDSNPRLDKWLSSYYSYAMQHIWSDDKVLAVTPFVLKGSPGPFEGFSFFDENDQPTQQYHALQSGLEKVTQTENNDQVGLR